MKIFNSINLSLVLVSSIIAASAWGKCHVNLDFSCSKNFHLKKGAPEAEWADRPLLEKSKLFNSADVQDSLEGCIAFTRVMRSECQVLSPVQLIFQSPRSKQSVFINLDGTEVYKNRLKYGTAIKNYFAFDPTTAGVVKNANLSSQIGSAALDLLKKFILPVNLQTQLNIPTACEEGAAFAACGIRGECIAPPNSKVGEIWKLTKERTGISRGKPCSQQERLEAVLTELSREFNATKSSDRYKTVEVKVQQGPGFKAFGQMALMDQIAGYVQGIFLDRYGQNLAKPGICTATSHAMMATALKSVMPYKYLDNVFDSDSPAQILEFKRVNTSRAAKLRYREYAAHVEAMFRVGAHSSGKPLKFPERLQDFSQKDFFSDSIAVDRPQLFGQDAAGWYIFFESDHKQSLSRQVQFENNYKKWIENKRGVVFSLQGTHSQPVQGSRRVIGHAVALQGYSADRLIVNDPWNVVSHLKFDNYQFPDAGKITTVTNEGYDSCIKAKPAMCKNNTERCMDFVSMLQNRTGGSININVPYCSSTNPRQLPTYSEVYNKCIQQFPCPKTVNLMVPKGTFRMLAHVGANAGYVGQKVQGTQKTAAYVTSFHHAEPWPVNMSSNIYRGLNASTAQLSAANTTGEQCTLLAEGKLSVGSKDYMFYNPIPYFSSKSGQLSSAVPMKVGCRDLFELNLENLPKSIPTQLIGTFELTCKQGKIDVTKNNCQEIERASCNIPNGEGVRLPKEQRLGFSEYYSGYECNVAKCNPGYRSVRLPTGGSSCIKI